MGGKGEHGAAMNKIKMIVLLVFLHSAAFAQLSPTQKRVDFEQLAGLFAKRYAFVEWKAEALGVNALTIENWLERAERTESDREYFALCAQYVAQLQDGHAAFLLPTNFRAWLPFGVDIYQGKPVIDQVSRTVADQILPGDELVSLDGEDVDSLLQRFELVIGDGNPRSRRRVAASFLTNRPQALLPEASQVPTTATVVVRRGSLELTFHLPWEREGTPYEFAGPVATPRLESNSGTLEGLPEYLRPRESLMLYRSALDRYVRNMGTLRPAYQLPSDFRLRLGGLQSDPLFSGVFEHQGRRVGLLRIPNFNNMALRDLDLEIRFFEDNTDALLVDVTRNPGGSGCLVEWIAQRFTRTGFQSLGASFRVTWDVLGAFESSLQRALILGAPPDIVAELERQYSSAQAAYRAPRGFTEPLPICGTSRNIAPVMDRSGQPFGYTKPVVLLIDEMSYSSAELFAALLQDNGRAILVGMRTNGAGGAVASHPVGHYTEASARLPQTIAVRTREIAVPGFPVTTYIENVGVQPDVELDYMELAHPAAGDQEFWKALQSVIDNTINGVALGQSLGAQPR